MPQFPTWPLLRLTSLGALALAAACSDDGSGDPASDAGSEVSLDATDAGETGSDAADDGSGTDTDGSGDTGFDTGVDTGLDADASDTAEDADAPVGRPYPEPGAWPANRGPGGPAASFTEDQLYVNCAYLDGGPLDTTDHHNLVVMYDGYLVMPWAPEWGGGGLTFFDVSDPCNPTVVGTGYSRSMRETHAIGFSQHADGRWAVVNQVGALLQPGRAGVQFWDVSDPSAPAAVADMELPGAMYPDSYARVPLAVFWQAPYAYVASADNGVHIVDATDPTQPEFVGQYVFDPVLRAGQVHAIGNLLVVTAAEGPRTVLLDISDPAQPVFLNEFLTVDEFDIPRANYFSNVSGGYAWYARKEGGGGLFVYDIRDPLNPTKAGQFFSLGNGGYVFVKEGLAFVGESGTAAIYDVSDLANITQVTRLDLEGDLDTLTPIGNIAVLSVDDEANPNEGTAMAPYATEPDSVPPAVNWVYPDDGSDGLSTTSRVGLSFTEMVDANSAWEGSVRLYVTGTDPAVTRVDGIISTQEAIVNFFPVEPLSPSTSYTLEVPAGGIVDYNGNAIVEPFTMTFTTGAE